MSSKLFPRLLTVAVLAGALTAVTAPTATAEPGESTTDLDPRWAAALVMMMGDGETRAIVLQLGRDGAVETDLDLGPNDVDDRRYYSVDVAPDGRVFVGGTQKTSGQAVGVVAALVENAESYLPPPLEAQPIAAGRDVDGSCPAGRVPASGFGDVPASAAHATSIDCVVWWKVAGGRTATQYAPAAPVTRAQMATFIANAIERSGDVLPEPSRDWFADDNGTTHSRNINRLAEAGVIAGRAPGVYAPVSRGAMAKFLAVSYEYTSFEELPDHVDYFADDNGHVLELFVNKSASLGLAAGSGSGYAPGGDVRRDQMATFIARWLDLVVERFNPALPD